MKFLLILFNLYSSFCYAVDISISKESIKSAIEILNQVPSTGTVPINLCNNHIPVTDFVECSQAKELNRSIQINFKEEGWKRESELELLVNVCFQKRFEKCYPALRSNIKLGQIKNLFNEWKKDPRFRYPAGAGMCHYRAEALSYHLAELGYKTTTIRIEHSPTLIAMDRDVNDNLNGNYDDYRGYHTLVQIMVNDNGKQKPYLLDPQYMTEPMARDKYFIKTMGQVCEKTDDLKDMTSCSFKEQPQNKIPDGHDLFNPNEDQSSALNCGWSGEEVKTRISIWPQPINKPDKLIVKTNGGEAPAIFKGKEVSENTSKQLILYNFENYATELKKELESINARIKESLQLSTASSDFPTLSAPDFSNTSPGFPTSSTLLTENFAEEMEKEREEIRQEMIKRKEIIIYSLKKIENKINIVKNNLEISF